MQCLDLQMLKIANAQPNQRYVPVTTSMECAQERIKDLTDLGKWNNAHYGETIHIIGAGPSARNFTDLAAGRISIGVNGSCAVVPDLTYWLACDPIDNDRPLNNAIKEYIKTNTYCEHFFQFMLSFKKNPLEEICANWTVFKQTGEMLERRDKPHWRNGFYFHHCSVHAAMELARLMGAKTIYLWGVDYHDRSHAYTDQEIVGDCKDNPGQPWTDFEIHKAGFEKIKAMFDRDGIEVFNTNMDSRLEVFPKKEFNIAAPKKTRPVEKAWDIRWRMFVAGDEYIELARKNAWEFGKYELGVKWDTYEPNGTWMGNCLQRPKLLKKVFDVQTDFAVGLLDADVYPVANPELFKVSLPNWDIMVRFRGKDQPEWDRYCAGYVAFARTNKGEETLDEWVRLCEEDPDPEVFCREQAYLCRAIEKINPKIMPIDQSYDFVPPKKWDGRPPVGTVLVHHPASRKLLKVMGGTRGTKKK